MAKSPGFWPQLTENIRFFFIKAWSTLRLWIKQQPKRRLWLWGLGVPVLTGTAAVGVLVLSVYLGFFGPLPTYAELRNVRNSQASEVYAEDGALLGKYYIENRTNVTVNEVSDFVLQALIATEDARFFEHSGVDLRALGRVFVKSLLFKDDAAGGGSTLSQQLAKNLFPRRQYAWLGMPINKLREMFTARRLEKVYTKEELLALYLNTVPFGEGAFGIKVAAFRYFGKDPAELTLEEAATLVGMLKATTYYNPRTHPEAAMQRRNTVLLQMSRYGNLDTALVDSLQSLPLALDFRAEGHNQGTATYFREHLRQELDDILAKHLKPDGTPYNLYRDGLKIYTTIDSRLQRYAENAVVQQMPRIQARFNYDWRNKSAWSASTLARAVSASRRYQQAKKRGLKQSAIDAEFAQARRMTIFDWDGGAVDTLLSPLDSIKHYLTLLNTGLLSVDPGEGVVRAWVGGIDHRFIQYDHVKARRPVGSVFKPIVYAAALQSGMMPCEYTADSLRTYPQFKNWQPRNATGKYGGAYSMAGALSKSVNTVAVELALRAGIPQVCKLARQMGIAHPIPNEPAIALGAVDADLREMVTVYATFANRGYR
ncbi:MAG: penicillin-binding protein, partial [Bacteroidetes bacterium]